MASDQHYDLIFDGRLVTGRNPDEVQRLFTERFGENAARAVFGRNRVILRKDVPRETAVSLQRLFEQMGMVSMLLPRSLEPTGLSLEDGTDLDASVVPRPAEPQRDRPEKLEPPTRRTNRPIYTDAEIDAAFSGKVRKPRPSLALPLALVPVAAIMLLLPLVYFALFALAGYGLYRWVMHGPIWWPTRLSYFLLAQGALYTAVILGGALLLFFLLRPIVARRYVEWQPVRLDANREQAIFHLTRRIAASVGAPAPTEIRLNAEANASAGLKRGFLSNKLVLTIGLPLIYGMNVQTLSGILAHEFGHFAQGISARLYVLVTRINAWFYSKSELRDSWDWHIEEFMESDSTVLQIAAAIAATGAALCRGILKLLAKAGHVMSLRLSRQMEFDADRYEIALTGSEQYVRTAHQLAVLSAAYADIHHDINAAYDAGQLVDDVGRWAAIRAQEFPDDVRGRIVASIARVNDSVYDTHPSDLARIRKARDANLPGQLCHDGPAENLFRDLERLGRQVSLQWYRQCGLDVQPNNLVPLDCVRKAADSQRDAYSALEQFLGPLDGLTHSIPLVADNALEKADIAQLSAALKARVAAADTHRARFVQAISASESQFDVHESLLNARYWNYNDVPYDPPTFGLSTTDPEALERKLKASEAETGRLTAVLGECAKLVGLRLSLALELAVRGGHLQRDRLDSLRQAYLAMCANQKTIDELYQTNCRARWHEQTLTFHPDSRRLRQDIDNDAHLSNTLQIRLLTALSDTPDPLHDGRTLDANLPSVTAASFGRSAEATASSAAMMLRQHARVTHALLGRMAEAALMVESVAPLD